ncbi:MAG: hypothetical protein ACK5V2_13680, partial [Pseudomonadota bacterium]
AISSGSGACSSRVTSRRDNLAISALSQCASRRWGGVGAAARDRPWVVVALLNHPQAAAKGRPVLDALIALLATQGGASENLQ